MSTAAEIREFVLHEYVKPAFANGSSAIINVGEVHDRLGMVERVPAVVSAIGGRLFRDLSGAGSVRRDGRPVSPLTTFTFEPPTTVATLLPPDHLTALQWFEAHAGSIIAWSIISAHQPRLSSQAKGIFKPETSPYALSIKVVPEGRYADEEPAVRDGRLLFRYHQEEIAGHEAATYFTNLGLAACIEGDVPVGVMRRVPSLGPVHYEILGLGRVLEWQDSFFTIELDGIAHEAPPIEQPPLTTALSPKSKVPAAPPDKRVLPNVQGLRVRDITSRIRFSDQIYGSGSEAAPVLTFARQGDARTSYTKTAINKIDWKSDYILQYVPISAPPPRNEELVGKLVSLVSIYPKEGPTKEFLDPNKAVEWDVDRWPDAIMLREVFWFVEPPHLKSLLPAAEFQRMTSHSRNRLGEPPEALYEAIKDLEVRPVLNLYRSASAQKYLDEVINPNPAMQVVANRRTGKAGYVYALTLPEYPGLLKIGSAFDPSYRVKGLSTAVPSDFTVADAMLFDDCRTAERAIHLALSAVRHRLDREWFKASLEDFRRVAEGVIAQWQAMHGA